MLIALKFINDNCRHTLIKERTDEFETKGNLCHVDFLRWLRLSVIFKNKMLINNPGNQCSSIVPTYDITIFWNLNAQA